MIKDKSSINRQLLHHVNLQCRASLGLCQVLATHPLVETRSGREALSVQHKMKPMQESDAHQRLASFSCIDYTIHTPNYLTQQRSLLFQDFDYRLYFI